MDVELKVLERKALEVALSGEESWKRQLRRQCESLRVTSRRYTGFGFYTHFACDGCTPVTDLPPSGSSERVPVAWAAHPGVEKGGLGAICFSVFLKDGIIDFLEGASASSWPETEDLIVFSVDPQQS